MIADTSPERPFLLQRPFAASQKLTPSASQLIVDTANGFDRYDELRHFRPPFAHFGPIHNWDEIRGKTSRDPDFFQILSPVKLERFSIPHTDNPNDEELDKATYLLVLTGTTSEHGCKFETM
jgi:hypothetical protein